MPLVLTIVIAAVSTLVAGGISGSSLYNCLCKGRTTGRDRVRIQHALAQVNDLSEESVDASTTNLLLEGTTVDNVQVIKGSDGNDITITRKTKHKNLKGTAEWTNLSHIAAAVAIECKIELPGVTKDTEANRLTVKRWIARFVRAKEGLRSKHAVKIIPIAVELVFTPTEMDILMSRARATGPVIGAKEDASRKYWTYLKPSTEHLLGRVVYHRTSNDV